MKKRLVMFSLLFAAAGLWFGCSETPTGSGAGAVQFAIDIESPKFLQQQPIDSLWAQLTVTASDMETVDTTARVQPDGTFELQLEVPVGRTRTFLLELFKEVAPVGAGPQQVGATRLYTGMTIRDVVPGGITTVPITLVPVVPMLKLTPMVTHITAGDTFYLELTAYNMPGLSAVNAVFDYGYGIWLAGNRVVDPMTGIPPSWLPAGTPFYADGVNDDTQYGVAVGESGGPSLPMFPNGITLATIPFSTGVYTDVDSGQIIIPMAFDSFYTWLTYPDIGLGDLWLETSELIVDPVKDSILYIPDQVFRDGLSMLLYGTLQDVTLSDALTLYSLQMVEWSVSDITGIENFSNLSTLDAGYNNFTDISRLAALRNLYWLSISGNGVADLRPLSGLTSLYHLHLPGNAIVNIAPLTPLTGLWDVDLSFNQIANINPLSGLTNLWRLDLSSNQISSAAALQPLTSLHYLNLSGNPITDILPLVNNTGLATGDTVLLLSCPLSVEAAENQVRLLQQRGVFVAYGVK